VSVARDIFDKGLSTMNDLWQGHSNSRYRSYQNKNVDKVDTKSGYRASTSQSVRTVSPERTARTYSSQSVRTASPERTARTSVRSVSPERTVTEDEYYDLKDGIIMTYRVLVGEGLKLDRKTKEKNDAIRYKSILELREKNMEQMRLDGKKFRVRSGLRSVIRSGLRSALRLGLRLGVRLGLR
jgi:hypothetical protein